LIVDDDNAVKVFLLLFFVVFVLKDDNDNDNAVVAIVRCNRKPVRGVLDDDGTVTNAALGSVLLQ
jgi:hypothetical protein